MSEPCIGILGGSGLYSAPEFEGARELEISTPFGSPSDCILECHLERRSVQISEISRHPVGCHT